MFIWDFTAIVTFSISVCLALVVGAWLVYTFYAKRQHKSQYQEWILVKQCPFCALVFLDYLLRKGTRCPRCHSYLNETKEMG